MLIKYGRKYFIILLILFFFAQVALSIQCRDVVVLDGDTIKAICDNQGETKMTLHLWAVDCPELGQPFFQEAREFMQEMIKDKQLQIEIVDYNVNNQPLVLVFHEGKCLNAQLLEAGLAWLNPRIYNKEIQGGWPAMFEEAKNAKIGIFQKQDSEPPWEIRMYNKYVEVNRKRQSSSNSKYIYVPEDEVQREIREEGQVQKDKLWNDIDKHQKKMEKKAAQREEEAQDYERKADETDSEDLRDYYLKRARSEREGSIEYKDLAEEAAELKNRASEVWEEGNPLSDVKTTVRVGDKFVNSDIINDYSFSNEFYFSQEQDRMLGIDKKSIKLLALNLLYYHGKKLTIDNLPVTDEKKLANRAYIWKLETFLKRTDILNIRLVDEDNKGNIYIDVFIDKIPLDIALHEADIQFK